MMPKKSSFPSLCLLLSCLLWSAAGEEATSAEEEPQLAASGPLLPGPIQLITTPRYEQRPAEDPAADEAVEAATDTDASETALDADASETELPETADSVEPEPKPELTPAMAALRDRVRRTLATFHHQPLSASENTATELMDACLAFGCATEVYRSGSSGQKINGIGCLCWNFPCAGFQPLVVVEGGVAARIGYGLQQRDAQLLAMLALSRVQEDYTLRIGEETRNVADLVECEKLSCRSGTDLSLKLIGLSYYAGADATWQNSLGEEWSTERLMGLSYAVQRRDEEGPPLQGQFARAKELVDEFAEFALKLQNSDGSWSPYFFTARGTSRDPAANLRSTGRILQWLAMTLPEDQLEEPRMVRSVEYVNGLLGSSLRSRRSVRSQSTREIGSVMHALHALAVYDARCFADRAPATVAQ